MTTPTPPAAVQMPELPHPTHPTHVLGPLWSADQMHTYAQAYAAQRTAELEAKLAAAEKALNFYADKEHFDILDTDVWDTVSGEPQNYWYDEASTAVVEDGAIARLALTQKEHQ